MVELDLSCYTTDKRKNETIRQAQFSVLHKILSYETSQLKDRADYKLSASGL